MKNIPRFLLLLPALALLSLLSLFAADWLVQRSARGNVFDSSREIPHNKVGLLLGTGKVLANGRINLYYQYRIEAAAALFKAKKVDFILVSGDNSSKDYDEPTTFKEDLMALGVPAHRIYLDYAGFRTLDSVVRCREVFGQSSITVISQQFHNERALFIARHKEMQAVGFNARDVNHKFGFKTRLREKFARVKVVLDLLWGKQPKFLGKPIEIK